MMRLNGRVAMVTGCGGERGLGRGIARRLAADGADLVLIDVAPKGTRVLAAKPAGAWGGLPAVAAEIEALGRRAVTGLLDIRSARQIDDVIARALEAFGRIDILVNNAAAPPGADRVPVVELPEEAWDVVLDTNLKGTFLVSKAVARVMLEKKIRGRIVNIASDRAKVGTTNLAAYCASKFGLVGLTQCLAMELAPAGITVKELIAEYCGGMLDGHAFYAYLPGGASGGILPASMGDIPLDFDTLQPYGCFIGSAAVMILSDRDRATDAARNLMQFFSEESCGQCTPCRVGTAKALALLDAPIWNQALLAELSQVMIDASICGLGQAAPNPVLSVMKYFPHELV